MFATEFCGCCVPLLLLLWICFWLPLLLQLFLPFRDGGGGTPEINSSSRCSPNACASSCILWPCHIASSPELIPASCSTRSPRDRTLPDCSCGVSAAPCAVPTFFVLVGADKVLANGGLATTFSETGDTLGLRRMGEIFTAVKGIPAGVGGANLPSNAPARGPMWVSLELGDEDETDNAEARKEISDAVPIDLRVPAFVPLLLLPAAAAAAFPFMLMPVTFESLGAGLFAVDVLVVGVLGLGFFVVWLRADVFVAGGCRFFGVTIDVSEIGEDVAEWKEVPAGLDI